MFLFSYEFLRTLQLRNMDIDKRDIYIAKYFKNTHYYKL